MKQLDYHLLIDGTYQLKNLYLFRCCTTYLSSTSQYYTTQIDMFCMRKIHVTFSRLCVSPVFMSKDQGRKINSQSDNNLLTSTWRFPSSKLLVLPNHFSNFSHSKFFANFFLFSFLWWWKNRFLRWEYIKVVQHEFVVGKSLAIVSLTFWVSLCVPLSHFIVSWWRLLNNKSETQFCSIFTPSRVFCSACLCPFVSNVGRANGSIKFSFNG